MHLSDAVPAEGAARAQSAASRVKSAASTTSAAGAETKASSLGAARPRPPAAGLDADLAGGSVLRLDVENQSDVVVIRLSGVLVGAAARHARAAMVRALATAPGEVVADLTGVTAADSSGAVLLVAMRRHARRLGSSLRLVGAGGAVRRAIQARGVGFLLADEAAVQPAAGVPASAR